MKQHITQRQLDELDNSQRRKIYREILKDNERGYLLSIGQMMEFLGYDLWVVIPPRETEKQWGLMIGKKAFMEDELVDALWMAVKEKLK